MDGQTEPNKVLQDKKDAKSGCLTFIVIGLVFSLFLSWCNNSTKTPEEEKVKQEREKERDNELSAYVFAEEYVRNHISSPTTAKFGSMSESTVEKRSDNTYYVSGFLDAQNKYGATVRIDYSCEIILKGENAHGRNINVRER